MNDRNRQTSQSGRRSQERNQGHIGRSYESESNEPNENRYSMPSSYRDDRSFRTPSDDQWRAGERGRPYQDYGYDYRPSHGTPYGSRYGADARAESEGYFAGRGPKGYRRSNDRIKEDVCDALTRDANVDASDVDVSVEDGTVILKGTVHNRRMKRFAEDCVERVHGVSDVRNELRVQSDSELSDGHSRSSQPQRSRAQGAESTSKNL